MSVFVVIQLEIHNGHFHLYAEQDLLIELTIVRWTDGVHPVPVTSRYCNDNDMYSMHW